MEYMVASAIQIVKQLMLAGKERFGLGNTPVYYLQPAITDMWIRNPVHNSVTCHLIGIIAPFTKEKRLNIVLFLN